MPISTRAITLSRAHQPYGAERRALGAVHAEGDETHEHDGEEDEADEADLEHEPDRPVVGVGGGEADVAAQIDDDLRCRDDPEATEPVVRPTAARR